MTKKNQMFITPEIHFDVVDVTPAIASEWLSRNFENNRAINKSAVARFAEDMANGSWKLTHQGVAFDEKGRMIDGQHRCLAVKLSGATVRMVVSSYAGASPLENIDRGTARTIGAVLEVSGEFSRGHGNTVASTINSMTGLVSGAVHRGLSIEKMREVYACHRNGIDVASAMLRAGKITAPFAAALAYVHPICPQRIENLFTQAINNDGLSMYSGAWHLSRLIATGGSQTRVQRIENSRAAVKCALLHMKDREVKLLKVAVEGSFDGMEWAGRERVKLGFCAGLTG